MRFEIWPLLLATKKGRLESEAGAASWWVEAIEAGWNGNDGWDWWEFRQACENNTQHCPMDHSVYIDTSDIGQLRGRELDYKDWLSISWIRSFHSEIITIQRKPYRGFIRVYLRIFQRHDWQPGLFKGLGSLVSLISRTYFWERILSHGNILPSPLSCRCRFVRKRESQRDEIRYQQPDIGTSFNFQTFRYISWPCFLYLRASWSYISWYWSHTM